MLKQKPLFRLAQHLQKAWQTDRREQELSYMLDRLQRDQRNFEETRVLLAKARAHDLLLVLPRLREQLLGQAQAMEEDLSKIKQLLERSDRAVPSLACLAAELRQLEAEFGEVTVDWAAQFLSVQTDPVVLEGVALGSFAIRFFWQRLLHRGDCFEIVALQPNSAASNDHVTHPHVKDGSLCAGEAAFPLDRALREGRLADAFCLARSVLSHYNPRSPFVPLEEWGGTSCQDCGNLVVNDDRYFCERCENDFCSECMNLCSVCEASRCNGCLERCEVCLASGCPSCLKASDLSDRLICSTCTRECVACGNQIGRDEIDTDTYLCPACSSKEESDNLPSTLSPESEHGESSQSAPTAAS